MKLTTNNLSSIKHLLAKILFSSQLIVISAGVPALYCVGVSHHAKKNSEVVIIRTNKGKIIRSGGTPELPYNISLREYEK
jgi:hypothetical protein